MDQISQDLNSSALYQWCYGYKSLIDMVQIDNDLWQLPFMIRLQFGRMLEESAWLWAQTANNHSCLNLLKDQHNTLCNAIMYQN